MAVLWVVLISVVGGALYYGIGWTFVFVANRRAIRGATQEHRELAQLVAGASEEERETALWRANAKRLQRRVNVYVGRRLRRSLRAWRIFTVVYVVGLVALALFVALR